MNVFFNQSMKKVITMLHSVTVLALLAFAVVPTAGATSTSTAVTLPELPSLPSLSQLTETLKIEPVTCKLRVSENEVSTGGSVTVYWETSGLNHITINGTSVSGDNGELTFDNLTESTQFKLSAANDNGAVCNTTVNVTCLPPVTKECELTLHKSVDKSHAKPGDELTYTIVIENTGGKDCTGGGVRIFDDVDHNLEYLSHTISDNLSAGYGSKPVFVSGTLRFNGHVLKPGEKGTISWVGKVKHPQQCGDFDVHNKAKATARELNRFMNWSFSNNVTTNINNSCTTPTPPQCPIDSAPDRIIIDFADERLRSNRDIDAAQTAVQAFNVPAGKYDIRLVSYDGYVGRETVTQNFEQYQLEFLSGNNSVAVSSPISDLADRVVEDTKDEVVDTNFMLTSDADGLRATHAFFGDTSSANSLNPICASLDPIDDTPKYATLIADKIVCTDEADLPNYSDNSAGGPDITANTAADWVANHPSCSLVSGWEFEWAGDSVANPDDALPNSPFYGKAGGDWTAFGPTNNSGRAVTQIPADVVANNSHLWFREVLQDGFIPFTFGPGNKTNADNVSAETYCHVDVKNYDNYDRVDGITANETYHCVSWNSEIIPDTPEPRCDFLTANPTEIRLGESTTLTWETTNATVVSINNNIGQVDVDGSTTVSPDGDTTYKLTATGVDHKVDECEVRVKVDNTPDRPVCPFTPDADTTVFLFDEKLRSDQSLGNSQTKIQTANFAPGLYQIELASWDAYSTRDMVTQPNEQWQLEFLATDTQVGLSDAISDLEDKVVSAFLQEEVNGRYRLESAADGVRAIHAVYPEASSPNSVDPICAAVTEVPDPAPSCDLFTANPDTIMIGDSATLTWETSNATRVVINNGLGEVDADGSVEVSPNDDIVYQLTVFGTNDRTANCEVPVTVTEDSVPRCELFEATPSNLPLGGGEVTLNWEVTDATSVTISPTIGIVSLFGSTTDVVTESTTYTLTAVDGNGDETSCTAPVTVPDPIPFTCANNVEFGASPNSVRRGADVALTWNVTNADSVSISEINATSFSGSETVNPTNDTTYVLTATLDNETIECPASVNVSTGGGGGGSSSPRCELDISAERINLGDEITLTWDTSRARDITISDDLGNVIVSTKDVLAGEKEDLLEGTITLEPTRNTEYTLVAERGSRDRTCRVEVELEEEVVIIETRDQEPLVAGISLSAVPYTGFEAGPALTIIFYTLLMAWAGFIAYLVVARKATPVTETATETTMQRAELMRPDAFVSSVTAPEAPPATVPTNLPSYEPTVGYENVKVDEAGVAAIEDRAHSQKALLSSDAIRHFVSTTKGAVERNQALDQVISEAKKAYPLEDGWIVINESRMQNLCEVCKINRQNQTFEEAISPVAQPMPEGSSSLAEAIVTGNLMAAYEMIGKRPMFSLADAAADLDAVYRKRQGEDKAVSDLLETATAELSNEQIKDMITALTSALDGTYTDEASAVKMAIMKAVKVTG
jgi:uncharacterized repeat protein (TIGR01451 family)